MQEVATKLCRVCLANKPLSSFGKQAKNKDGMQSKCNACFAVSYVKNREKIRARQVLAWKDFSLRNSEILKEKSKKAYQKRKKAKAAAVKQYKIDFAPKYHAKNVIKSMKTKGQIMKQPCEKCGEKKVDAHHDDYSKPDIVRWLCRRHHAEWHKENGEAPNGRAALAAAGAQP